MSLLDLTADTSEREPAGGLGWPLAAAICVVGLGLAAVMAILVSAGLWHVAAVFLFVAPAFYLVNRYPLTALMVWLVVDPFLMAIEGGGSARQLYWLVHRALPVGAVLLIVVGRWIGVRREPFPRLGWPDAMAGGYLVFTLVSIAYRSQDPVTTYIYMWDHVLVPLSIYLFVRLLAPDEADLRRLVPVFGFFLVSQAAIGALSLVAPGALAESWMGREYRTTGTLRHPNVYGSALLVAGLYVAHHGQAFRKRPRLRKATSWMLVLAAAMGIATLSRATWLAVVVVLGGLFFIYPQLSRRIVGFFVAAAVVAAMIGGIFTDVGDTLSSRLYSEDSAESALSRLPVIVASLRMIESRPVMGWGYENFDRYDQSFQSSIEGLYVPDRDHASHNFFLTLGAEGGLLGLFLYLGPILWCAMKTRVALSYLPRDGFRSRRLVWILWVALAAQFAVYNFSNNRVAFGLALWWLTVGLLVTVCDWRGPAIEQATDDARRRIERLGGRAAPAWEAS